jgi:hypothetical protein
MEGFEPSTFPKEDRLFTGVDNPLLPTRIAFLKSASKCVDMGFRRIDTITGIRSTRRQNAYTP